MKLRKLDAGIREATIVGQGIGMSIRGLKPIAEIQYLDYILYCIQILSDDPGFPQLSDERETISTSDHQNREGIDWRAFGIRVLLWPV